MKKLQKKLMIFVAVFALVMGFSLFVNVRPTLAAANDGICQSGETNSPADCNGICDSQAEASQSSFTNDDCNGVCERGDTGGLSSGDCDGICEDVDTGGSFDCNGTCQSDDTECSPDCDPLGRCAFGQETQLAQGDVRGMVARIINIILGLLGTVAVVIIIVAGFKWMTAGGGEDKLAEARKLMFAGVIGLAIVLAAYSIATFVVKGLTQAIQ